MLSCCRDLSPLLRCTACRCSLLKRAARHVALSEFWSNLKNKVWFGLDRSWRQIWRLWRNHLTSNHSRFGLNTDVFAVHLQTSVKESCCAASDFYQTADSLGENNNLSTEMKLLHQLQSCGAAFGPQVKHWLLVCILQPYTTLNIQFSLVSHILHNIQILIFCKKLKIKSKVLRLICQKTVDGFRN